MCDDLFGHTLGAEIGVSRVDVCPKGTDEHDVINIGVLTCVHNGLSHVHVSSLITGVFVLNENTGEMDETADSIEQSRQCVPITIVNQIWGDSWIAWQGCYSLLRANAGLSPKVILICDMPQQDSSYAAVSSSNCNVHGSRRTVDWRAAV